MIILIIPSHAEAKPFIAAWDLKKDLSEGGFEIFGSQLPPLRLLVCGKGKMNAAIGTAAILARCSNVAELVAINIGIAEKVTAVCAGDIILINQVVDAASREHFYPDQLVVHDIPEGSLLTVDSGFAGNEGLNANEPFEAAAADFEGSGFFQAAAKFLFPDQIVLIKGVSEKALSDNREKICRVVEAQHQWTLAKKQLISRPEEATLKGVAERLSLTFSEYHELKRAYRFHKSLGKAELDAVEQLANRSLHSKHERRKLFERASLDYFY